MKKYFIKIIVLVLIVLVFPLANSFCFEGLFDSLISTSIAQAAANNPLPMAGMNACGENQVARSTENIIPIMPLKHENSLLPCCVDGGHSQVLISSPTAEIGGHALLIFFSGEQAPKLLKFSSSIYYPPIISPPKLLAVSTTILRI